VCVCGRVLADWCGECVGARLEVVIRPAAAAGDCMLTFDRHSVSLRQLLGTTDKMVQDQERAQSQLAHYVSLCASWKLCPSSMQLCMQLRLTAC